MHTIDYSSCRGHNTWVSGSRSWVLRTPVLWKEIWVPNQFSQHFGSRGEEENTQKGKGETFKPVSLNPHQKSIWGRSCTSSDMGHYDWGVTGETYILEGGGGIAQSLASLSTKRAARVRSPLNPLVSERWNSISVLLTRSHQC